jgi:hypothetical protein
VLWGDTHLHNGISFDAGAFGARLLPKDAYRFARGDTDAPRFLVAARKEPMSGNLDWTHIVKGWLDAKGGRNRSHPDDRHGLSAHAGRSAFR